MATQRLRPEETKRDDGAPKTKMACTASRQASHREETPKEGSGNAKRYRTP